MHNKIKSPKMVYVVGEEMTRYGMKLILEQWVKPYIDISNWVFFDLSVKNRDDTNDQVLQDLIEAGKEIKSIFKEPTITPTNLQKKQLGLKNTLGSPNGAMRRGWNGITISRDTIHIDGLELGFKNPVLFDRQAVGGEYGAGYGYVGKGKVKTIFYSEEGGKEVVIDERELSNEENAVVTYHNPLDDIEKLAHHFFSRSLEANVTPYVVTKKTVFKWQEKFWQIMQEIFNKHYKQDFLDRDLLKHTHNELAHLISDAACMQVTKWHDGGFAMVSHNYDGDMLTDLISQIHRSPGFISSTLIGVTEDGDFIKEFEASHGTVSDMFKRMEKGLETSLNPLGMVHALINAMEHSADIANEDKQKAFTKILRKSFYKVMTDGRGTRDLVGPSGSTTEEFVELVAGEIAKNY